MEMNIDQAKHLLERVTEFPDLPHNLLSTATDDDRRDAIAAILRWWNEKIVPILTELGAAEVRPALKVVGHFTLEGGILCGPRDYMEEQGDVLLDKILAREDTIFNMTKDQSPDIETAILVRLQTDYAGWLGFKQAVGYIPSVPKGTS